MSSLLQSVPCSSRLGGGSSSGSGRNNKPSCLFSSHLPNLHTTNLNNGFAKVLAATQVTIPPRALVFSLPNWKSGKNDNRTKDLRLNEAFLYLEHMVDKGHKPNAAQATQLLYDLCKSSKIRKGIRVMELMVISGKPPETSCFTYLVNQLCKRGNVGYAMQLVEKMDKYGCPPNTTTYNSLVRGLCIHGNLQQSLQLLEKLMQKGLVPNVFTYSFLLEAAYKERGVDEAERLLEEIIAKGGKPNLVSYNVLLTGLCKEGRLTEAMTLFRNLPAKGFRPNVVSYNIILRSLCYDGRWEDGEELLSEMGELNCVPSLITYNILIGSLAFHGRTEQALVILSEMSNSGFKPNSASFNPIIARYCKEGDAKSAQKVLDLMVARHVGFTDGTYNAIALLCEDGTVKEAFQILEKLRTEQKFSMHGFYRNVISYLCKKGNTLPAFQLLNEMTKNGFTPDNYTNSSLIRGLCMEGMLDEAWEIFTVLEDYGVRPDIDNYNALILGFCKSQRTDLSFDVYVDMIEKDYQPNETTYTILVEGIAHENEVGNIWDMLKLTGVFNVSDFIPGIWWLDIQRVVRKMKRHHKVFDTFLNNIIAEHEHAKKDDADDLLSVMIGLKNRKEDLTGEGELVTDTHIKAILADLFAAGTDTTSSTLEWSLAELIRHPDILVHLQEEIDNVVGRDRLVSETDLPNLPFLHAVIKEVLRLHPPTPLSLPHVALESCQIQGYHIPKNTTVLVNVWAISRDPEVWKDPLEFRPSRFLPGGNHANTDVKGNDFELIPFSAGRRICAGMSLGLKMLQFLTATLVHSFDWKLPGGQFPDKLNMEEEFGLTLQRAVPLAAHPMPRLLPTAYNRC